MTKLEKLQARKAKIVAKCDEVISKVAAKDAAKAEKAKAKIAAKEAKAAAKANKKSLVAKVFKRADKKAETAKKTLKSF